MSKYKKVRNKDGDKTLHLLLFTKGTQRHVSVKSWNIVTRVAGPLQGSLSRRITLPCLVNGRVENKAKTKN